MNKNQSQKNISVAVRVRPLLKPIEDQEIWFVDTTSQSICVSKPYEAYVSQNYETAKDRRYLDQNFPLQFNFDYVFGPETKTQQIYQQIGSETIEKCLGGFNGTIFMYGQTTSGKTYTMLGSPEDPGMLPCAIQDIFDSIQKEKFEYNIWVSYLEIYNEQINDLLNPGNNNLRILEDPRTGVTINGLRQEQVADFEQVIILMNYGEEHRAYRGTNVNDHSSRSHTIFKLYIEISENQGPVKYSQCNLVDLAGSERLNEYSDKPEGNLETSHINKSLFALSKVISKLSAGKYSHIPYRDSKLTRILSQSLGGNSYCTIICTVSPAAMNYYQTISTLRFAITAKQVKNQPMINEVYDNESNVNQYKLELVRLKEELSKTNENLEQSQKRGQILENEINQIKNEHGSEKNSEIQELREQLQREKQFSAKTQKQLEQLQKNNSQLKKQNQQNQDLENINNKASQGNVGQQMKQKQLKQNLVNQTNELQQQRQTMPNSIGSSIFGSNLSEVQDSQLRYTKQNLQPEMSFLDNLVFQIDSALSQTYQELEIPQKEQKKWIVESKQLQSSYRLELLTLQNRYRDVLRKNILKLMPEAFQYVNRFLTTTNSRQIPQQNQQQLNEINSTLQLINQNQYFQQPYDLKIMFNAQELLKEHPQNDDPEFFTKIIHDKHEKFVSQLEQQYDQARQHLEILFRQKLQSKQGVQQNQSFVYIREHEDTLKKLRQQYDEILHQLEICYVDALKVFDDYFTNKSSIDTPYSEQDISPPKSVSDIQQQSIRNEADNNNLKQMREVYEQETQQTHKAKSQTALNYTQSPKVEENGSKQLHKSLVAFDQELGQAKQARPIELEAQTYLCYLWGSGKDGKCGNNAYDPIVRNPRLLKFDNQALKVKQIVCGHNHSACVDLKGHVFT